MNLLLSGGFFLKEGVVMTDKQKRFCNEYLIDCNATQAAIRAGYSPKTANEQSARLLANVSIKTYIEEQLNKMTSKSVADAEEVMKYLTSVLRGESSSEEIVVEGCGDGCSEARTMKKAPSEKDKLKAAELLGKRYGIWKDTIDATLTMPVIFEGEERLEE